MNFSGVSGTPESLPRRRRKPIPVAYSGGRWRHRSLWGHLLHRKLESGRSYVSAGSYGGSGGGRGTAGISCFPATRAADVRVRKLAAGLRKLPFESEGSHVSQVNCQMESATKWDLRSPATRTFDEPSKGLLQDSVQNANAVASLQTELRKSQLRINKLESENISLQKKIKHLNREHKHSHEHDIVDVHPLLGYLRHKLDQERIERRRTEAVNSRLIKKLIDSDSYMKRLERQRDAAEEICGELVGKIGVMKEDMEEDRRMLQMAEVWREERSKMKIADAKVAVQEKFDEMSGLIFELETFLRLKKREEIGEMSMRKAESLRRKVESVDISGVREFEYLESRPEGDDINSIIEEIQLGS